MLSVASKVQRAVAPFSLTKASWVPLYLMSSYQINTLELNVYHIASFFETHFLDSHFSTSYFSLPLCLFFCPCPCPCPIKGFLASFTSYLIWLGKLWYFAILHDHLSLQIKMVFKSYKAILPHQCLHCETFTSEI